jgi:uncharacterized protein
LFLSSLTSVKINLISFLNSFEYSFFIAVALGVLLMGLSKSGFGAGIGFLAIPLIASYSSLELTLGLMLPILTCIDLVGLRFFYRHFDRNVIKLVVPVAVCGMALGFLFYKFLNSSVVSIIVGILILTFLLLRLVKLDRQPTTKPNRLFGSLVALLSGFSGFVAHNGVPILAYLLPLRLEPIKFAATLSIFFTAINIFKWAPYSFLGILQWNYVFLALMYLPLVPIGVWLGYKLATVIPEKIYYRIVTVGMLIGGLKLLFDGVSQLN